MLLPQTPSSGSTGEVRARGAGPGSGGGWGRERRGAGTPPKGKERGKGGFFPPALSAPGVSHTYRGLTGWILGSRKDSGIGRVRRSCGVSRAGCSALREGVWGKPLRGASLPRSLAASWANPPQESLHFYLFRFLESSRLSPEQREDDIAAPLNQQCPGTSRAMELEYELPNATAFWFSPASPFDNFSVEAPTNASQNATGQHFDLTSNAILTFIYFVVCIIGLCGNTLVIYVILCYAKMKTITNIYILNLAIADELFMLGLPFLAMQVALVHWPFGKAICRIVMTVDGINQFTSIFCLTVMSIDRYLAVVHPIKSAKWRRPRTAKMISVAVWGVSLLVIMPIMIYAGVQHNHGRSSCTIIWPGESGAWYTGFIIYTFILGFLVPLTIICLCYLFIIIKVKSSGIRVGSSKRKKSEKKVTRMVSIVVAVFIFCWLPFYIFNVSSVSVLIVPTPVLKGMFDFVVVLSYANSCANPILYAFLSDNFKKSFQNVLCLVKVSGMDEADRSDSKQDKSRLNETTETQRTLLNGDLQTSI